jgi:hypothetical protein
MFIAHSQEAEDNALTYAWASSRAYRAYNALTMQLIGAETGYSGRVPTTSLQLPDIPAIAPATGKDHWGYERVRDSGDATWTIVSPSPRPGFGDDFTSLQTIEELAKEHFKSGKEAKTQRDWSELQPEVRQALKDYVNDSATLDELRARLNPATDDNSDSENQ